MMPEFTVREYAAKERVAERTVRRWIDKGAVHVRRTPGGGVRIVESSRVVLIGMSNQDKSGHPSK